MSTVVLLSGGLDSACCLDYCADECFPLFARYGQPHQEAEERAARAVAKHYGVSLTVVDLPQLGGFSGDTGAASVVPNRNMILIALAANYAELMGADRVVIGSNATDYEHYPDCRPEFTKALGAALQLATGVKLSSPFELHRKEFIRDYAKRRGVPTHLTWSCYRGGDVQCGECGACTA